MSRLLDWLLELIIDIAGCVYSSREGGWRPLHMVVAAAAVIALAFLAWYFLG